MRQLVAVINIGQVINQTVAVTLQATDVAVLVVSRYLFRIGSCTVSGVEQAVQAVIGERVTVAASISIPAHAADVTVVVTVITQGLRELVTADACQPVLDVVAVCQRIRSVVASHRGTAAQAVIHVAVGILILHRFDEITIRPRESTKRSSPEASLILRIRKMSNQI